MTINDVYDLARSRANRTGMNFARALREELTTNPQAVSAYDAYKAAQGDAEKFHALRPRFMQGQQQLLRKAGQVIPEGY